MNKISLGLAFVLVLLLPWDVFAFQRIGSSEDLSKLKKSGVIIYACPALVVDISVSGRRTGAILGLFGGFVGGALAYGVGMAADKSANEQVLARLLEDNIQDYSNKKIKEFFDIEIDLTKIVTPTDTVLTCKDEQQSKLVDRIVQDNETLFFDSKLSFLANDDGDFASLILGVQYSIPGKSRDIIWRELYIAETVPGTFEETNPGRTAKKLFDDVFALLQPWIKKDIEAGNNWYSTSPKMSAEYKNGTKVSGYLLANSTDMFVIREAEGIIRITPKKNVANMEYIKSEGQISKNQ